jgi:hypothetical protein
MHATPEPTPPENGWMNDADHKDAASEAGAG